MLFLNHNQSQGMSKAALVVATVLLTLLAILSLLNLAGCRESVEARAQPQEQVVPLQVVEGQGGAVLAFVPIFIQGQGPFAFALDTGASQSLIDLDLVEQLNLPKIGVTREVTGITGAQEATLIRVEEWRLGAVSLPATVVISLDLPEPGRGGGLRGLLGSDILSTFGAITVDYERQQLILRSRRTP